MGSRMQRFHDDPDHSSKIRSYSHGRYEDPAGDFATVREDDQECSDDGREEESVDHPPL